MQNSEQIDYRGLDRKGVGMSLLDDIKNAGVVGAGGAGFPTHAKLASQTEYILLNAAECEPLLRVDQQLMANIPLK